MQFGASSNLKLLFSTQLLPLPVVRGGGYFFCSTPAIRSAAICGVQGCRDFRIRENESTDRIDWQAIDLDQSPHIISEPRRGYVIEQVIRPEIVAHRCDLCWDHTAPEEDVGLI